MSAPLTSPGGVVRPFGWSHFHSFGASSWIFARLLLCTLFLGIFALGLRPKSSFWTLRGHFFLLSFLCVLPAFAICFSLFFGSSSRLPFLCFFCFPCGLPFFYFFGFSPGSVLCFISFVFLGTSVLWLFPYIFLFYFYIFLFVRLSIRGREG